MQCAAEQAHIAADPRAGTQVYGAADVGDGAVYRAGDGEVAASDDDIAADAAFDGGAGAEDGEVAADALAGVDDDALADDAAAGAGAGWRRVVRGTGRWGGGVPGEGRRRAKRCGEER